MSDKPPKPGSFAYRLAYVRWLRSAGQVEPESDLEFCAEMEVTSTWLNNIKLREIPPFSPQMAAFARRLEDEGFPAKWLLNGEEGPPIPSLWALWRLRQSIRPARSPRIQPKDLARMTAAVESAVNGTAT